MPAISVNDVSLYEGNNGSKVMPFVVSLSSPAATPVTVTYATANGTASAGEDFVASSGLLTFAPGETNQTIPIQIIGDISYELNEAFTLALSGASNATLLDNQGAGTILNDDSLPTLSISDVVMTEGNTGTNNASFTISLSAPSGLGASVSYATANGNATSGSDYTAKSGSVTIPAGSTNVIVVVSINVDLLLEPDEVFYVDLSSAGNAILLKREAYCLILNDDGLPGQLDHFAWSPISPVQYVGTSFIATITALDAFNDPAVGFNGTAAMLGSNAAQTNTILGNVGHYTSSYGTYTMGYSFTPDTSLTVTHVRSYSGTKVSIWNTNGTLLASQAVSGSAGVWKETPLASPLLLAAGTTYRIGFYTGTSGYYYYRTDGTNRFAHGSIHQSYYSSGDVFPTSVDTGARWWFVDLRYTTGLDGPAAFSPAIAGPFVNGIWTGSITPLRPVTNLFIWADDNNGHAGSSSAFAVELRNDLSITLSDSPDPVPVGGTISYLLSVTNIGPSAATGVVVSNWLPATATLISADHPRERSSPEAGS